MKSLVFAGPSDPTCQWLSYLPGARENNRWTVQAETAASLVMDDSQVLTLCWPGMNQCRPHAPILVPAGK